jgi:L-asparaginase
MMHDRRSVAVIATGGTIASQPRERAGVVAQLRGAELVAGLDDPLDGISVEVEEHSRKNAFLFTADELMGIATTARSRASSGAFDGVVVTHGTDTMEETAFLTDLLYGGAAPIVFTGAQRHAAMSTPDGPRNLAEAIRIAAHPSARDLGVLVALEGRIDAARDVTKLHTWALRAFGTHEAGSVGGIGPMGIHVHERPVRLAPYTQLVSIEPAVHLIKLVAGIDGTLIDAARLAGARGIVIEAFGLGNVNHVVLAAIERAIGEEIVVMIVSRCPQGGVYPVYGDGGGHDVAETGAVFGGRLSGQKARILLMATLASAQQLQLAPETVLRAYVDAIASTNQRSDQGVHDG